MPKVILDAGHGGSDIGDYYERRSEKNDNLMLALRVGEFLMERGVEVAYTRTADVYLPMMERVSLANQIGGDLLVSLHRLSGNSYQSTPGLDFFVNDNNELGVNAANNIGQSLIYSGYDRHGIIDRTDIPLLSETNMPAIMAGIGYVRSREDNLNYDNNFVQIAEGIANGIYNTLLNAEDGVNASEYLGLRYRYRVGIVPYSSYDCACEIQLALCTLGCDNEILKHCDAIYIYTSGYVELDEAVEIERKLRRCGFHCFVINN